MQVFEPELEMYVLSVSGGRRVGGRSEFGSYLAYLGPGDLLGGAICFRAKKQAVSKQSTHNNQHAR